MNDNIFTFISYSEYLKVRLGDRSERRGLKSKLATVLDVKNSFISRILSEQSNLTLEQAYDTTGFLELSPFETEYFIKLVLYSRAGNFKLKEFHKEGLIKFQKESEKIGKRIKEKNRISEEDAGTYYSRWIYLAIHIAVSIPELKTFNALLNRFDLEEEELKEILAFLSESKIINFEKSKNRYNPGNNYTHIDASSKFIFNHHYNWRIKSLETIAKRPKKDLHYSGVFSLSKEDVQILKNDFLKLINARIERIKPSKEEVLYCQIIDFFEIN